MASQANTSTMELTDGREVHFSYGVPVAAFIPGKGYIKTDRKFSMTTSRHANAYAGKSAPEVPDAEFCTLIAPVECKR